MRSGDLNLTFHTASALPSEPLKVEILITSLLDKLSAVTNTRERQLERKKSSLGLSISEVPAIYREAVRAEQLTSFHPGSREKGKEGMGWGEESLIQQAFSFSLSSSIQAPGQWDGAAHIQRGLSCP